MLAIDALIMLLDTICAGRKQNKRGLYAEI